MTERAHIRNGVKLAMYVDERGRVKLENGGFVSPLVIGYINGNDKIVEVVRETDDTSTGPDIVTTRTETVEANRVHILTEIRDMTAQEIDDRDNARAVSEADQALAQLSKHIMALQFKHLTGLFNLTNMVRANNSQAALDSATFLTALEGQTGITANQYVALLNALTDDIPNAAFIDKIKQIIQSPAQIQPLFSAVSEAPKPESTLGRLFRKFLGGKK